MVSLVQFVGKIAVVVSCFLLEHGKIAVVVSCFLLEHGQHAVAYRQPY